MYKYYDDEYIRSQAKLLAIRIENDIVNNNVYADIPLTLRLALRDAIDHALGYYESTCKKIKLREVAMSKLTQEEIVACGLDKT